MADASDIPADASAGVPTDAPTVDQALAQVEGAARSALPWAQLWQLPALLVSLGVFGVALTFVVPERQEDNFAEALNEVSAHVEAGRLEQAKERLNLIGQHLARAPKLERGRFRMLNADMIFIGQTLQKTNIPELHKDTQMLYGKARELGTPFDAIHLQRYAETMVALGEDAEALRLIDAMKDEPAARRYSVIKKIIKRRIAVHEDPDKLAPMLERFLGEVEKEQDVKVARREKVWALDLKMAALLAKGDPDAVIKQLLRHILQLKDIGGDEGLAPLRVLLAEAYATKGEYDQANRTFLLAQQTVDGEANADELSARILIGQAKTLLDAERDYERALGLFRQVFDTYPRSSVYFDAVVGLGTCEAHLGTHPEAVSRFSQAAKMLEDMPGQQQVRKQQLANIARAHHSLHTDKDQHELGLNYLNLLVAIHGKNLPADDRLRFAQTHGQLGRKLIEQAKTAATPAATKLANQGAWRHLNESAQHYIKHEELVRVKEPERAKLSLWQAAENLDQANEWDKAVALYERYVSASESDDPKHVEALGRLGMAHAASHRHEDALVYFRKLDRQHPDSRITHGVLVPMAKSLWATKKPDLAKEVLLKVVSDHPDIRPESREYRDAIVQLGKFHHELGEYEAAIARLDQAVKRYPNDADAPMLRYTLADAYRKSVDKIQADAAKPMPESARAKLLGERARRLEEAQQFYDRVVDHYRHRERKDMDDLTFAAFRNAYFYRADAAFELGRYDKAIELYDEAANKWSDHPSSLVALVQIVNANCELGNIQSARVANQRAREQLKRLPDSAFDDETLPMTRRHWQDWLRWTEEYKLFKPKGSGGEVRPASDTAPAGDAAPTPAS